MIKPSSGGFNMDKFFDCDCPRCKPELYIINKDERIKELEQELERYKEFIHEIKVWDWSSTNSALNLFNRIKEFEEAKE